jgi:hypothetical protein
LKPFVARPRREASRCAPLRLFSHPILHAIAVLGVKDKRFASRAKASAVKYL